MEHWEKLLSYNLLLSIPVVLSTKVDCLTNYIQLFENISFYHFTQYI